MDGSELFRIVPLVPQQLHQPRHAAARADHAEIGRRCAGEDLPQAVGVPAVAARDDADVVAFPEVKRRNRRGKSVAHGMRRLRKARRGGEVRPVIHNGHFKIQHGRHTAERLRYMSAAEQNQPLAGPKQSRILHAVHPPVQHGAAPGFKIFEDRTKFFPNHGSHLLSFYLLYHYVLHFSRCSGAVPADVRSYRMSRPAGRTAGSNNRITAKSTAQRRKNASSGALRLTRHTRANYNRTCK